MQTFIKMHYSEFKNKTTLCFDTKRKSCCRNATVCDDYVAFYTQRGMLCRTWVSGKRCGVAANFEGARTLPLQSGVRRRRGGIVQPIVIKQQKPDVFFNYNICWILLPNDEGWFVITTRSKNHL